VTAELQCLWLAYNLCRREETSRDFIIVIHLWPLSYSVYGWLTICADDEMFFCFTVWRGVKVIDSRFECQCDCSTSASTLATKLPLSLYNSILSLSCPKGRRTAAEHPLPLLVTVWCCTICDTHHRLTTILFHKRLNSVYYWIRTLFTSILYDTALTDYVKLWYNNTVK